MKSLIVHIGPYKTGSTAIQRVLAASRRSLESAAILYPTSRKTKPLEAHHSLARFLRTGPGPGISLVYGPDELAATLASTLSSPMLTRLLGLACGFWAIAAVPLTCDTAMAEAAPAQVFAFIFDSSR